MIGQAVGRELLLLGWIAGAGAFSFACTARYLSCPLDPILLGTYGGIVFGIYGLNRFTDGEDQVNRPERRAFRESTALLAITTSVFAASLALLAVSHRLTAAHIALALVGVAYSVRLLPVPRRGGGMRLLRLKDVPLLKAILASLVWASAAAGIHLSLHPERVPDNFEPWFVIGSSVVPLFLNANFFDLLDVEGDRLAGVPTLPVLLGERWTLGGAMAAPALLLLIGAAGGAALGRLSLPVLLFVAANLLHAVVYLALWRRSRRRSTLVELLADGTIFVFAVGLLLLRR